MHEWLRKFAIRTSAVLGSPWSIVAALCAVAVLLFEEHARGYSAELLWTFASYLTIVTFVMVVIMQNAQKRHDRALQLKLDELLRSVDGARTQMVNLQGMSEDDLEKLELEFKRLRERTRPANGAVRAVAQTAELASRE
jgi:low affinity Fe/Cu permease